MSNPNTAPTYAQLRDNLASGSPYVYDHVPTLRELMPSTAGLPGVIYSLVCLQNAKDAQDAGWGSVEGAKFFSITGPRGTVSMVLACKGTPIRGASPKSGARRLLLDLDIYRMAGVWLGLLPKSLQTEFNLNELGEPVGAVSAPLQAAPAEATTLVHPAIGTVTAATTTPPRSVGPVGNKLK